jgi:hypothetical protein
MGSPIKGADFRGAAPPGGIFKIPGNGFGNTCVKIGFRDISQGGGDFCSIDGVAAVVAGPVSDMGYQVHPPVVVVHIQPDLFCRFEQGMGAHDVGLDEGIRVLKGGSDPLKCLLINII